MTDKSKKSKYISAQERVKQFPTGILHADSGKLFCLSCNVTIDFSRKNTIDRHIASESHIKGKSTAEVTAQNKKQATVASMFKRATESSSARKEATFELVEAFTAANIPLDKMDNPKLREYFNKHVANAGSFPCANKLRQDYLPELIALHVESVKSALAECDSVSIVADKATDAQDNYILHILFVPGSWNNNDLTVFLTEPFSLSL